jgi:hypothetical protein
MDPVILSDILTALLVIALVVAPTWLVVRYAGLAIRNRRARLVEPDNCGDQGGLPGADTSLSTTPAPTAALRQIGSEEQYDRGPAAFCRGGRG